MNTETLQDRIIAELQTGGRDVEELSTWLETTPEEVRKALDELISNGRVEENKRETPSSFWLL